MGNKLGKMAIKSIIERNELGTVRYFDSTRINLGLIQPDVNVTWDLAPHDFSVMNHVLDEKPVAVSAHGLDFTKHNQSKAIESLAYVTVYFESELIAHFNINWFLFIK